MKTVRCWPAWISAESKKAGPSTRRRDNNWRLAPIHGKVPLNIRFETAPTEKAAAFIKEQAPVPDASGCHRRYRLCHYQLDLSK
ncbi:2',3'-cyclic-nucleotide 2'-phosphodiesterase/3'-nucleotidase precursor [Raoultella terrigena]|uniref:2',3'-cyclic-nucleotide 2'-phosphodiesterase/3'-nucleotidase n=1 Tax=Raoultella terrigena TaxID=577 RepID=A0A4U9DBQ6_RAOTE|nr:2',3'-cyclic-nucleotide 2'-phosphodiesterase/3'-nucleotidase precursor [Raoultella terrigena]